MSGFIAGSLKHTIPDFSELELITEEEQTDAIRSVLNEIGASDYCGPHPPQHTSDEPRCKGARMLQFAWQSDRFDGKRMYFKFCIAEGDRLAVLRIHTDYSPNKFRG